MTDSISSLSSASSASNSSSSNANSTKLTSATKSKLEALGVDTTNITTEAEGQIALKSAQAKQKAAQHSQASNSSEDSIKSEAKSLASSIGVSVADNDSTDTILSNIASKLTEMKADAGEDETKLAEVQQYEQQYEAISGNYTAMQASQAQLAASMNGLATYNKAELGL